MKIIKEPDYSTKYKTKEQAIANIGCEKCPYCESEDIHSLTYRHSGLFRWGYIDQHTCKKCGAIWKSKLYGRY